MKQILTTEVFEAWFSGLRDIRARVRIQARIDRAGLGDRPSQPEDIKRAQELARGL